MALAPMNSVLILRRSAYCAVGSFAVSDGVITCSSLKQKLGTKLWINRLCSCVQPCYAVWNGCTVHAIKLALYFLYKVCFAHGTMVSSRRVSGFQFVCKCVCVDVMYLAVFATELSSEVNCG